MVLFLFEKYCWGQLLKNLFKTLRPNYFFSAIAIM
jgi:hypothetical protein